MNRRTPALFTTAVVICATPAFAAPIDTWNIVTDSTAGSVNSGLSTDSPTFGNNTTNNVTSFFVTGEFGETVSLAIGETLTVTYGITLTGGTDNLNVYRFLVGDYGVTAADAENWTGAWNFVNGTDIYQGRTDGNIQSTGGNADPLGATEVTSGSFDGDSTAAYTLTFSITRDSATTVDLAGSLVGGDGSWDNAFTVDDKTTTLFDYNGVGILFGNSSELDQAVLSGAQYTVVPEPGSLALLGLGGLLIASRRRRA